jgi:membrane associated rhomboid family serine protease
MITILLTQSAFDALVPQVSMKAHLSGAAIGFLLTLLLRYRLQPEGG